MLDHSDSCAPRSTILNSYSAITHVSPNNSYFLLTSPNIIFSKYYLFLYLIIPSSAELLSILHVSTAYWVCLYVGVCVSKCICSEGKKYYYNNIKILFFLYSLLHEYKVEPSIDYMAYSLVWGQIFSMHFKQNIILQHRQKWKLAFFLSKTLKVVPKL